MNELVQLVMQKTGLPQDKAQELVDAVVTHLKGRLPETVTSHLEAFLSGGAGQTAGLGDTAKAAIAGLSGLFGKSE